jgi:indolepyruvate ferredoxin oxidoreductase beta subunit
VLEPTQVEVNRPVLKPDGVLIPPRSSPPTAQEQEELQRGHAGRLSALLDIPEAAWLDAIHARLAAKLHRLNDEAFALGRQSARDRFHLS